MKEYWEENLHALGRQDLIRRLHRISNIFNALPLPIGYPEDQLYFIVQDDYEALKIGLSKKPLEKLASLRGGHTETLILLFYYDPMEQQKRFEKALPDVKFHPRYDNPAKIKEQQVRWLRGAQDTPPIGDWTYPDSRALQILIKRGMIYLKELMGELGLDYSQA